MHSTFYFNSTSEITADVLDAIKLAFKGKSVVITVEEASTSDKIPDWQKKMVIDRLHEMEENPQMILSEDDFMKRLHLLNK